MEYWMKIGLSMVMFVVISGQNKTAQESHPNLSCRKPVIDGKECPKNKKCPVNVDCDDPSLCPCMDGYISYNESRAISCEDIHECISKSHNCGAYTRCKNTDGGYSCVCDEGFRKGNFTEFCPTNNKTDNRCSDIDECEETPSKCGPNAKCNNTIGSFQCVCKPGFLNVYNQCIEKKKCEGNPRICGLKGICKTTKGSLSCSCQLGYKAVSLGFEYPQCNVKCKIEIEIRPPCDDSKLLCQLDTFTNSHMPLCDENSRRLERSQMNKFLDDLDELISNFSIDDQEQRLRAAGQLLDGVEGVIQNLAFLFHEQMPVSNDKYFISASKTNKTLQDTEILLRNRKSSIRLAAKTALGDAYTSVVGCLEYANLSKLLEGAELRNDSQNETVKLVSPVVSVFLGTGNTANLSRSIQLHLNFSEEVTSNKMHCAFWSVNDAAWSTEGCKALEINQHGVVCSCSHLTSFAVLMAMEKIESWTLDLITQIGLSISIVCLALAIITFCLCRFLRGTRNTIHIHLCVCLLLGHCIFLIGIEATTNKAVCGIVAGLLHFFYLCAFCWMSLEGLELYLMLVTVFKTQVKTRYLLAAGYGVPTLIVTISAAVYAGGYGTTNYCWLSLGGNFIWSFMGPVCVIILVNCGIFVLTVWKLAEKMTTINPDLGKLKRIRALTVTSIAQLCILGCCWAFGFLMFGKTALFFAYAFTICNVLQGVQIFFLHCLMNKKVRETYSSAICAIAHFRSPLYSEFSNSTNVNTQSRAKTSKESGL